MSDDKIDMSIFRPPSAVKKKDPFDDFINEYIPPNTAVNKKQEKEKKYKRVLNYKKKNPSANYLEISQALGLQKRYVENVFFQERKKVKS